MAGKIQNWMYAAAVLGFLQVGELFYNLFQFKLAGQIIGLCAFFLIIVWVVDIGFRLVRRNRTE
ncbi:hypothetical protein [Effusibacillus lacus]|uniref:Uncharacterized protein n=1 Tax=Effusibacillus lacus TaxID=1348429 RepID=A0A292YKD7_9BACL|nr:hypothetical protein [Effusibacillus lacus]TCS74903.1 hypothetical protein EDD64_11027 [Effusibacillus lacus]GAX91577.1 hypothetical protein EFBL_3267 [Effusibacillus lacus]